MVGRGLGRRSCKALFQSIYLSRSVLDYSTLVLDARIASWHAREPEISLLFDRGARWNN